MGFGEGMDGTARRASWVRSTVKNFYAILQRAATLTGSL
jgi:hypothetical protein